MIFQDCLPFHRPGETALFPLLTYQAVRQHAAQLVAGTRRRYVPLWPPEPDYGDLAGERRLTDAQVAPLAEWVNACSPQGEPIECGRDDPISTMEDHILIEFWRDGREAMRRKC